MDAPDEETTELAGRLFDAARSGEVEMLLAYIDAGAPLELTNGAGDSLLMLAAYHGHAGLVISLLSRGAEVDRPNDRGQTPLAGAVFKGHEEVVRALLDGGADPAAGTPDAISTAQMMGREEMLEGLDG